ncbi:hypothetical protein AYJ54_43395 [Bradyrhizobium centrolobii]|uniref:Polysaccharide deacetylase n=1 Tax=Bradyrhizobium centrolobii TaxID=1505087 RepID=A0A176Z2U4_9BRAD|nr:hypothetical protein [Bradyrhizobium centrolobii]OAF13579.1 hypothetical protein AYJ54_43395 [Bradyrhizobium centrolobii]
MTELVGDSARLLSARLQVIGLWDDARQELDVWAASKLKARFWIRDDDAFEPSPSLERLRDVSVRFDTRIGLAIIPGKITPGLQEFLAENVHQFYPMCHGWKHVNYNLGKKPAEFGPDRPISNMIADTEFALHSFKECFSSSQPIFVPPFNRITPALIKTLPRVGFAGVSLMPSYLERKLLQLNSRMQWRGIVRMPEFKDGLRIDVHLDVIDWKARTAQRTNVVSDLLVQQLRGRRLGLVQPDAPIGLLTHHLEHDEPVWHALDGMLDFLRSHESVEFIDVGRWIADNAADQPCIADK